MALRETWAEISLDAITNNYHVMTSLTQTAVFPVVKANAYGHGDVAVSKHFETLNAPFLCVSSLFEALHLKENGIKSDILIFSYVNPDIIALHLDDQFIYTVPNMEWINHVQRLGLRLRLHVEVNVGMNRYGIRHKDDLITIARNNNIEGIYTHFQRAEDTDTTRKQFERFKELVMSLPSTPHWVHVGNAHLNLIRENTWINGFRSGLALYGYREDTPELIPALELYTKVTHRDNLKTGETIGYEYDFVVKNDGVFGTIPIGYADGFDMMNNQIPVFINDKPYDIVGKICMDQAMVHLDETVKFYDTVELIGPNRKLQNLSKLTGVSLYKLMTDLKERIHRIYK